MKNLFSPLATYLIAVFVICLLNTSDVKSQITSAPAGGNWNNTATWIGGSIPGATDDVIIASTVSVIGTCYCNNITIQSLGILENSPSNNYTLNINGNLINQGLINNTTFGLMLNVYGNVNNAGIMANHTLNFVGNLDQQIYSTQPLLLANFIRSAGNGRIKATSNLDFVGTVIDLNSDTLEFTSGNTIALDGGNLRDGVVYKSSAPALQFTAGNNAYVYVLKIDAPQTALNGSLLIYGSQNNFKTHLINNATLKSHPANSYALTIDGSMTNNGVIQNGSFNFFINISGDLTNNGTWENYNTILNGSGIQQLAMTQPYSGANFTKNLTAGRVKTIANISFVNTRIDFNLDTLEISSGNVITLDGGSINDAVFFKTSAPAIQFTAGNDAYIYRLTIDAPQTELNGNLLSRSGNNFKTHLINNATIKSHPDNVYTLIVDGNLTNNGVIKNGLYAFTINVSGDLTNNGSFKNYLTSLTGTNNRTLAFSKRFEGVNFSKSVAAGNVTATTDLIFDGAAVDLNGTLLTLPDEGYLSVLNGSFGDAVIAGNDIHFNTLAGYCFSTQFSTDVSLHGVFQAANGISFIGSVINQGTIRSYSNNTYSFTVSGNLVNNGSISNGAFSLTLTILGDITNNGTWSNSQTTIDGVADQYIYLNNTIIGSLRLDANNTGTGNWFGPSGTLVGNTNFSGATGQVLTFVNPVTSAFEGQYYRTGTSNSRSIYINIPANPPRLLTMNFLLEGLYLSNGVMRASLDGSGNPAFGTTIADQVSVELHDNSNFSNVLYTKESALLATDGNVSFIVPGNLTGSYYLAVRHRSGIVTVSATPVSFSTTNVNYNFDQPTKAYGNNMATTADGWFAFYGGDVNQDGAVDTGDMTPVDNESAEFAVGYRNPDTNGDGAIDTGDMTIVANNADNFVSVIVP